MHVIRNDYVPYQPEPVPFSHLSQRPNKNVSCSGSSKERQLPVAAKGEKVQVPAAVVSLQSNGHGSLPNPTHATPTCGAPSHSNAQVTYEGGILSSCDEVKRKERLPACVWATRPETTAHELFGHLWGEVFGHHPSGTAENKQDAVDAENDVRRTDPTRRQKEVHDHGQISF